MAEMEYYVIFPNVENGLRLNELLKAEKISVTIAPTPREATKCCGISLLIKNKNDISVVKKIVDDNGIEILDIFETENKRDPMRNRFC
jgi:putative Se/S carrier protein